MEGAVIDFDEADNGEADGVGPSGDSGGEYSVRRRIEVGPHLQRVSLRHVEVVEEDEVGEAADVFEAGAVFRFQFNGALNPGGARRLDGRPPCLFEGRVDHAYGLVLELHVGNQSLSDYIYHFVRSTSLPSRVFFGGAGWAGRCAGRNPSSAP